jgi:predicted DNA-binding transcriptional regulator YafY
VNPTHRMRRADIAYERKMRLYAYLAEHERWHSLRGLLVTIGGYLDLAQAREIAARGTTPPDLQRPYNTALKKLLRDIDDLEALGLVVERRETDCAATGETLTELRFARDAYAASEIELTEEHLAVLAVASALARSAPDSPIAEDALAAIEKLLPGANLGSGLPVSVSFKVPRTERDADVINRRLHRLAEMMRCRHAVTFDYHKLDGSVSRRTVELYGLGERVGLWYAVGRDLGDDRIKSFRVSRM